MFLMVWRIDAGDFAGGLQIAAHALKHSWVVRHIQRIRQRKCLQQHVSRKFSFHALRSFCLVCQLFRMFLMVWRIDAGDFAGGLQIAAHALKHSWVMPQALGRRDHGGDGFMQPGTGLVRHIQRIRQRKCLQQHVSRKACRLPRTRLNIAG
jgi:hypothetical protein